MTSEQDILLAAMPPKLGMCRDGYSYYHWEREGGGYCSACVTPACIVYTYTDGSAVSCWTDKHFDATVSARILNEILTTKPKEAKK